MASNYYNGIITESPTRIMSENETSDFQIVKNSKRKNNDRSPQNLEGNSKKSRKTFPKFALFFKEKTLIKEIKEKLISIHKDIIDICQQKDDKTIILIPTTERELNICLLDFSEKLTNLNKKSILTQENKMNNKYAINKIQIDISIQEIEKILKSKSIIAYNIKRETNFWGTVTTLVTFETACNLTNIKLDIYNETKTIRKFTPKQLQRCTRCQRLGHNFKKCKNEKACVRCARNDCGKECNFQTRLCTNCKGPHSAAYLGCPYQRQMREDFYAKEKEENIRKEIKNQQQKLEIQENKIKTFAECVKTINNNQKENLQNKEKINKIISEPKISPKDLLLILNKCFQYIMSLKNDKNRPYLIFDCVRENFNKIFGEVMTKEDMKKQINNKTNS